MAHPAKHDPLAVAWDLSLGDTTEVYCPACRGVAIASRDIEVICEGPFDDGCLGMAWEERADEVARVECPECGYEDSEREEINR